MATKKQTISLITALLSLAFLLLPASATALEGLVGSLPSGHNTVVAADMDKLRASPFFERGILLLESQPQLATELRRLNEEFGIDIRTDVRSLAMVTDAPPLSPALLANPQAAFIAGASADSGNTLIIKGAFDAQEILQRIAGEDAPASDVLRGDTEFRALAGDTIVVIQGGSDYRRRASDLLGSGPGASFTAGMGKLGGNLGIYLLTAPNIDASIDQGGADARFAGLGVHAASTVRLNLLLTLGSEEQAQTSATEFQGLREEMSGNPMLAMFGLRPVLQNLSIRQNDADVLMATSLTNDEAENLLNQAQRLAQSSRRTPQAIPGDRLQEPAPTPVPRDGVDADFN